MLDFLQANGVWLGAIATVILAIITLVTVLQSRSLVKQNRILTFRSYITEMIALVIDHFRDRVDLMESWIGPNILSFNSRTLEQAKKILNADSNISIFQIDDYNYYFPYLEFKLFDHTFNEIRLNDFREHEPSLISSIETFDHQFEDFQQSLLQITRDILDLLRSASDNGLSFRDCPYLTHLLLEKAFIQPKLNLTEIKIFNPETYKRITKICSENKDSLENILKNESVESSIRRIRIMITSLKSDLTNINKNLSETRQKYCREYGIPEEDIQLIKQRYSERNDRIRSII